MYLYKRCTLFHALIIVCLLALTAAGEAFIWQPPDNGDESMPSSIVQLVRFEKWNKNETAVAIETCASKEEIAAKLALVQSTVTGYSSDGKACRLPVVWDCSSLDVTSKGVYMVPGIIQFEPLERVAEGVTVPEPSIPVSVQEPNKPDINVFHTTKTGCYTFPWVTPPCPTEDMTVWFSEDDGEWHELEHDDYVFLTDGEMVLDAMLLKDGSSYKIQVDYTGGRTSLLLFKHDGTITDERNLDGDRDGGDITDTKDESVGVTQPAPVPDIDPAPNQPYDDGILSDIVPDGAAAASSQIVFTGSGSTRAESAATSGIEGSTAQATLISGLRANYMASADQALHVTKVGYDISLSPTGVSSLSLLPADTLSVTITATNGAFGVTIDKNGVPTAAPMTVTTRWNPSDGLPQIFDEGGNKLETVVMNPKNAECSFEIPGPGLYSIHKDRTAGKAAGSEAGQLPLKTIAAAVIALLISGCCILPMRLL